MTNRKNTDAYASPITFLVGSGDAALTTTVPFVTNPTTLAIANGQFAVLSGSNGGTVRKGEPIGAAVTAKDVSSIQIVQGTPNSTQLNNVSPFGVNDKAVVRSGRLEANKIHSVTTRLPSVGQNSAFVMTTLGTLDLTKEYIFGVQARSQMIDTVGSQAKTHEFATAVVPAIAADGGASPHTDDDDFIYQTAIDKLNAHSKTVTGNGFPYVVLGLDKSGGAGTAIGALQAGDSVNFITRSGTTFAVVITNSMLNTLNALIATSNFSAASTIEVVDVTTAGDAAKVDALVALGLIEDDAIAFDNSNDKFVDVNVYSSAPFGVAETGAGVLTATGYGKALSTWWKETAAILATGGMANVGHDYAFVPSRDLPNYIDETKYYTTTVIEFFNNDNGAQDFNVASQKVVILLEAAIAEVGDPADAPTAADGVVFTTNDTSTVASLNSILGSWLSSASDEYSKIRYNGGATEAAPFV